MLIGRKGRASTAISAADETSITVRGHDLCRDLMGRVSLTDYLFLLMTGEHPSPRQRFFLDLLLVSIAEHGPTPSVQAARMTLAADPDSLHGAVAAGILGCGSVILGTTQLCARAGAGEVMLRA